MTLPLIVVFEDSIVDARAAARALSAIAEVVHCTLAEPLGDGRRPDIVLCDLHIPPMVGRECLNAAREAWPGALIVPWSGRRIRAGLWPDHIPVIEKGSSLAYNERRQNLVNVIQDLLEWRRRPPHP